MRRPGLSVLGAAFLVIAAAGAGAQENPLRILMFGKLPDVKAWVEKSKPDLNAQPFPGYSYLMVASERYAPASSPEARAEAVSVYEYLIQKGAKPDAWSAARIGDMPRLKTFLGAVSSVPFMENGAGQNISHAAAASGSTEVILFLADRYLDFGYLDPRGRTALHYAALSGSMEVLRLMRERIITGTPAPADNDRRSPQMLAREAGMLEAADFMRDWEAEWASGGIPTLK
jgi:hypothetical protein